MRTSFNKIVLLNYHLLCIVSVFFNHLYRTSVSSKATTWKCLWKKKTHFALNKITECQINWTFMHSLYLNMFVFVLHNLIIIINSKWWLQLIHCVVGIKKCQIYIFETSNLYTNNAQLSALWTISGVAVWGEMRWGGYPKNYGLQNFFCKEEKIPSLRKC